LSKTLKNPELNLYETTRATNHHTDGVWREWSHRLMHVFPTL